MAVLGRRSFFRFSWFEATGSLLLGICVVTSSMSSVSRKGNLWELLDE